MRINKIGQSANLILLVGVLLATAVSAFAVYTTFDDIVRDMVMGDPDVAAREFASNMDLVASAPNEISVYTSTPLTAWMVMTARSTTFNDPVASPIKSE